MPETGTSTLILWLIKTLLRHQRQALTFMLNRENGWAFEKHGEIWEIRDGHRGLQ